MLIDKHTHTHTNQVMFHCTPIKITIEDTKRNYSGKKERLKTVRYRKGVVETNSF